MAENTVYDEIAIRKLYIVRNQKILIDQDLALFYSIETNLLRECVDRNIDRFPEDFMFKMTKQEYKLWKQDYLDRKENKSAIKHNPYCFTKLGAVMLSSVLDCSLASRVNINIMRIANDFREKSLVNKGMLSKYTQLEKKLSYHDEEMHFIFSVIKHLSQ